MEARPSADFMTELRISPRPVLAVLLTLGGLLSLVAEALGYPWYIVDRVTSLFLVASGFAIVGWAVAGRSPDVARWLAVLGVAVVMHLAGIWLYPRGGPIWAVVPVALAFPLLGVSGAAVVALGECAVAFGLAYVSPSSGFVFSDALAAAAAIWTVFGAMWALCHPVRERGQWLDEYFEHAQRSLSARFPAFECPRCDRCRAGGLPAPGHQGDRHRRSAGQGDGRGRENGRG